LLVRFGVAGNPDIDSVQRTAESQNLEIRQTLWKYESVIENHRREMHSLRREVLLSPDWSIGSMLSEEQYSQLVTATTSGAVETAGRILALAVIDDLWADYLVNIAELRGGIHWVSWGGRDPLHSFLTGAQEIFADLHVRLNQEIAEAFASAEIRDGEIRFPNEDQFERGATWTYLTTDQPFGTLGERIAKAVRQRVMKR
jgi:preprotein translocase subunit SecA